jgi:transposase
MTESIGIDVAKHELGVRAYPTHRHAAFPSDAGGRRQLVAWAQTQDPARIVVASASTDRLAPVGARADADLPVVVVNPRQIRAFGQPIGRVAKTDRIDAALIARFAAVPQPPIRPTPSPRTPMPRARFTRRTQLHALRTAQANQREAAPPVTYPFIDPAIAERTRLIGELDRALAARSAADAAGSANARLPRSIPGVGPATGVALLAGVPERGALAALVGVAPRTRQSGGARRRRHHGRPHRPVHAGAFRDPPQPGAAGP